MQLVLPLGAPSRGEHVGVFAIVVDLIGCEKSPISARSRHGQHGRTGMTGGVTLSVTVSRNGIFLFQKWMNSMSFCYFCVEFFRAPKIMKIFV